MSAKRIFIWFRLVWLRINCNQINSRLIWDKYIWLGCCRFIFRKVRLRARLGRNHSRFIMRRMDLKLLSSNSNLNKVHKINKYKRYKYYSVKIKTNFSKTMIYNSLWRSLSNHKYQVIIKYITKTKWPL